MNSKLGLILIIALILITTQSLHNSHHKLSLKHAQSNCTSPLVYNTTLKKCACPSNQVYNETTKTCNCTT